MRAFFVLSLLLLGVALVPHAPALAVSCAADFHDESGVCFPDAAATGLSNTSVETILKNFMNWTLAIFGFLGIIAFVISGMQYLMAAGDESTIETAKRNMKYSIIGIAVALSGFVIIQAISTALKGTDVNF